MSGALHSGHGHRGSSNIVPLLSLKLILLAFFILLNSLSEFEANKSRAVIESVNRAFNGRLESENRAAARRGSLGMLPELEDKIAQINGLFEAIVPTSRAERVRRADALRVDLPASSLFKPASDRLRSARTALVDRLAGAIAAATTQDLRYELAVLLGVGAASGEGAALRDPRSLEVRRAGVVAQRLLDKGLPPATLSIGLLPEHPGTVRFVLRARQQASLSGRPLGGTE